MDRAWQNQIIRDISWTPVTVTTMNATFRAPWGWPLRLTSSITTVALPAVLLFGLKKASVISPVFPIWLFVPVMLLPVSAAFMILGYEIEDNALIIKRPGWRSTISLAGLRSAESLPGATRGSVRVFGNGGLYSFTGLFWNKSLGRYRAFLTDMSRTVVLKLPDRTIVVSPENPDEFIRELQNRELLPRRY